MRGVAQHERPSAPEVVGHPMVDMVDREPIHLVDLEPQRPGGKVADIVEAELVEVLPLAWFDRPDQADATLVRQRENGQEVGFVEFPVQVAVECRARARHVGDVEGLRVGPAGKARPHGFSDFRPRAVAAGDESRLRRAFGAVGSAQPRADVIAVVGVAEKFGRTFHLHPEALQAFDQQPFVLVLREDVEETIGRQVRNDLFERHPRRLPTAEPQPKARDGITLRHDGVGEIELLIELQRSRMDGQRA